METCTEGKLLALHTSIVCLTRALVLSGALNRDLYQDQLDHGQAWLKEHGEVHAAEAFEQLLPMLKDI